MKFVRTDFSYLRWSTFCLAVALILSTSGLIFGQQHLNLAQQKEHQSHRQFLKAKAEIAQNNAQLSDQNNYQQGYQSLLEKHIVGQENRLELLETLERIIRQHKIAPFSYSINSQQNFAFEPPTDTGDFKIYQSPITMQFSVAHELQLFDFLTALQKHMPGQFLLEQCAISRTESSSEMAPDSAKPELPLAVDCTGAWLTFTHRTEP